MTSSRNTPPPRITSQVLSASETADSSSLSPTVKIPDSAISRVSGRRKSAGTAVAQAVPEALAEKSSRGAALFLQRPRGVDFFSIADELSVVVGQYSGFLSLDSTGNLVCFFPDEAAISDALLAYSRLKMYSPFLEKTGAFVWRGDFPYAENSQDRARTYHIPASLPFAPSDLLPGQLLACEDLGQYSQDDRHLTFVGADFQPVSPQFYSVSHIRQRLSPQVHHGFQKMHGRDKELKSLRGLLDVGRERGAFARVEGPAGIGKTRLLKELLRVLRHDGVHFQALFTRADRNKSQIPYAFLRSSFFPVLKHLFEQLVSVQSDDGVEISASDSSNDVSSSAARSSNSRIQKAFRFLTSFEIFLRSPQAYMDNGGSVDSLVDGLKDILLLFASSTHHFLMSFDDAQWIDDKSSILLAQLLQFDLPKTLVTFPVRTRAGQLPPAFQDVLSSTSLRGRSLEEIHVTGLSLVDQNRDRSSRVFDDLTRDFYQLPADAAPLFHFFEASRIAQLTDGNPLFLYNFFQTLADRGLVVPGRGRLVETHIDFDTLPGNQETLFQSQLERDFSPEQREIFFLVEALGPAPKRLFEAFLPSTLRDIAADLCKRGIVTFENDTVGLHHREFSDAVRTNYGPEIRRTSEKLAHACSHLFQSRPELASRFSDQLNPFNIYQLAMAGEMADEKNLSLRAHYVRDAGEMALSSYNLPAAAAIYDQARSDELLSRQFPPGELDLSGVQLALLGDKLADAKTLMTSFFAVHGSSGDLQIPVMLRARTIRRSLNYALGSADAYRHCAGDLDYVRRPDVQAALSPEEIALQSWKIRFDQASALYRSRRYNDYFEEGDSSQKPGARTLFATFVTDADSILSVGEKSVPPRLYQELYRLAANAQRFLGNISYDIVRKTDGDALKTVLPKTLAFSREYQASYNSYKEFLRRVQSAPPLVSFDPKTIVLASMNAGYIAHDLADCAGDSVESSNLGVAGDQYFAHALQKSLDLHSEFLAVYTMYHRGWTLYNRTLRLESGNKNSVATPDFHILAKRAHDDMTASLAETRLLRHPNPNLPVSYPLALVSATGYQFSKALRHTNPSGADALVDESCDRMNELVEFLVSDLARRDGERILDLSHVPEDLHELTHFSHCHLACKMIRDGAIDLDRFRWLTPAFLQSTLAAFDREIEAHSDASGFKEYRIQLVRRRALIQSVFDEHFRK